MLVSAITHLVDMADSPSRSIVLVLYKKRAFRWNHLKLLLSLKAAASILSIKRSKERSLALVGLRRPQPKVATLGASKPRGAVNHSMLAQGVLNI